MNYDLWELFINNKAVVNCENEQQAINFIEYCFFKDIHWEFMQQHETCYENNLENTCYRCSKDNFLNYSSKRYYINNNYAIITYNELFEIVNKEIFDSFMNEKTAISCETLEECKNFIKLCYKNGVEWITSDSSYNPFNTYKENICFSKENNKLFYSGIDFYEREKYKIITYKDLYSFIKHMKFINSIWKHHKIKDDKKIE